jgi:hypothetical protein
MSGNRNEFGCRVDASYAARHLIDCNNAFKVDPDGRISLSTRELAFSKIYSRRRIHFAEKDELLNEIKSWQKHIAKSDVIDQTTKEISAYLCDQALVTFFSLLFQSLYVRFSLFLPAQHQFTTEQIQKSLTILKSQFSKNIFTKSTTENIILIACAIASQSTLSVEKNNKTPEKIILSDLLAKVLKDQLLEIIIQTRASIRTILSDVFNNEAGNRIISEVLDKFSDTTQLISILLHDTDKLSSRFLKKITRYIKQAIPTHRESIYAQMAQLALDCPQNPELIETEALMRQELESKLTPAELELLESKKVNIIVITNFAGFSHGQHCNGKFSKERNSIYVKPDTIHQSLIHEVQHSFDCDLTIKHPVTLFRFYKQCKNLNMAFFPSIDYEMTDRYSVTICEHKAAQEEKLTPETQKKYDRAKYLLKLDNYKSEERTPEVIAHLRQFIADFGSEETSRILPKLYLFWKQEILEDHINNSQTKAYSCLP